MVILESRGIDRAREEVDRAGKIALFERRVPRRFQFFHDDDVYDLMMFSFVCVGVGGFFCELFLRICYFLWKTRGVFLSFRPVLKLAKYDTLNHKIPLKY